MDIRSFLSLECFDNLINSNNLKVGDKFLTGKSVVNQQDSKKDGDEISWFEVVYVAPDGNVEYVPRYGKLKKTKAEEK